MKLKRFIFGFLVSFFIICLIDGVLYFMIDYHFHIKIGGSVIGGAIMGGIINTKNTF